MKEHDITKLPKWAQARIWKLEADLKYYAKQKAEMLGTERETNVVLPYFKDDMRDQNLPNNTRVQFMLPNPRRPKDQLSYIEVRHDAEGGIDVHGSQSVWIEPTSGNCFKIKFRDG